MSDWPFGERLARIEEKLDHILQSIRDAKEEQQEDHADHENRLRDIEKSHWKLSAIAGAIATSATLAVTVTAKKLGWG